MEIFKLMLYHMTYEIFFAILVLIGGVYSIFIAPAIFQFWLKPKIEKRYNTKLVFNTSPYTSGFVPLARWGGPPIELALFFLALSLGRDRSKLNPNLYLIKINYDIKTASKSEVIVSYIYIFFLIY